ERPGDGVGPQLLRHARDGAPPGRERLRALRHPLGLRQPRDERPLQRRRRPLRLEQRLVLRGLLGRPRLEQVDAALHALIPRSPDQRSEVSAGAPDRTLPASSWRVGLTITCWVATWTSRKWRW